MRGEFEHNIDAKGRLFIPAKLREKLGGSFIITKGLDGCLFVYSAEAWDVLEEKINQLPMSRSRNLQRFSFPAPPTAPPILRAGCSSLRTCGNMPGCRRK